MAVNNTTFFLNGVQAVAGSLLRCRFTNQDSQASENHYKGSNVAEIAMTEYPLANNSGFSDFNAAPVIIGAADSALLPYKVEVRAVSAQTTVAFDDSGSNGAQVVLSCGDYGYLLDGEWLMELLQVSGGGSAINVGNTEVDWNYNGNSFTVLRDNIGVKGVQVFAYLLTDWTANPNTAPPRGYAVSNAAGQWTGMRLDSGLTYILIADPNDGTPAQQITFTV
jgi:hypothetical protein